MSEKRKFRIRVVLEADGFNPQVLTDKHIAENGILGFLNLVIGWFCMFYPELLNYTLQKVKSEESDHERT